MFLAPSKCTFKINMSIIVKKTHEYFNLDEKINPIVKALIEQPNHSTPEKKIELITGENFVKIQEQLEMLRTLAKNIVRYELQAFKDNVGKHLRVSQLFAAFDELMDDDLNFADSIAINKDTYIVLEMMPEENFSRVLSEFQRLYREYTQYSDYIDGQFKLYVKHIHDIVLLKCPDYVIKPMENFPNIGSARANCSEHELRASPRRGRGARVRRRRDARDSGAAVLQVPQTHGP